MRRPRREYAASLFCISCLIWWASLAHGIPQRRILASSLPSSITVGYHQRTSFPDPHLSRVILDLRGGSDDEEDYEEDDASNALEESSSSVSGSILKLSKRVLLTIGKITWKSTKAGLRAVQAAFAGDTNVNDEEVTIFTRISRCISRMWNAAFHPKAGVVDDGDGDEHDADGEQEVANVDQRQVDFGVFLSRSYDVDSTRDEIDTPTPVLGGTISDALKTARSAARLLVVLIPASRPGRNMKESADQRAIEGFLSAEVAAIAEKKARKKQETGSFLLWGAKAGSPEAVVAIKRLKAQQTNTKGQKRPILLVVYPAQVIDRSTGMPKVVPKLLAQHHCSPPPSPEMMAAWLNALRKRHAKQYASMQHALRELQIHLDRKEGYKDSMQSDKDRQERERKEAEERAAREQAEKERQEDIKTRREELRASIPDEPGKDEAGTKTIALRLADGRSAQRRFAPDTELSTIFNWVDVTFEMERETVILTTMTGQKSFSWDDGDSTLEEVGLGRMTGLRVAQRKVDSAGMKKVGDSS